MDGQRPILGAVRQVNRQFSAAYDTPFSGKGENERSTNALKWIVRLRKCTSVVNSSANYRQKPTHGSRTPDRNVGGRFAASRTE